MVVLISNLPQPPDCGSQWERGMSKDIKLIIEDEGIVKWMKTSNSFWRKPCDEWAFWQGLLFQFGKCHMSGCANDASRHEISHDAFKEVVLTKNDGSKMSLQKFEWINIQTRVQGSKAAVDMKDKNILEWIWDKKAVIHGHFDRYTKEASDGRRPGIITYWHGPAGYQLAVRNERASDDHAIQIFTFPEEVEIHVKHDEKGDPAPVEDVQSIRITGQHVVHLAHHQHSDPPWP